MPGPRTAAAPFPTPSSAHERLLTPKEVDVHITTEATTPMLGVGALLLACLPPQPHQVKTAVVAVPTTLTTAPGTAAAP